MSAPTDQGSAVSNQQRSGALAPIRAELLALAESCGACLTGKPDGSEAITVVFTITAWRAFDRALQENGNAR